MPVAAPADKRFRRARVSPKGRRPRRLSWLTLGRLLVVCALVGFGMYRAVDLVLSAEALTVTRITVRGNERLSRGEVLALLDGLRGESMVTADLERWRQKLLSSPWVADAALRRELPGTLVVLVSERQPMAIGRIADALYLIDRQGTIIDEFGPNYAEFDLPLVDGLASRRPGAPLVDDARAALAARAISDLQRRPDLAARVSQIDVSDVHDAVVVLRDDTALVHLGNEKFSERVQSYVDLVPVLRERIPAIDYVDLRFDQRVYVRPSRGRRQRGS
jgi:cell division septal protein FtsQ